MLFKLLGFKNNEFSAGIGWHDKLVAGLPPSSVDALASALLVLPDDVQGLVNEVRLDHEKQEVLTVEQSDLLFRIAVAFHRLHGVLKDPEACVSWLRNNRKEVGGNIPILLLRTAPGSKLVLDAISRIRPPKSKEAPPEPEVTSDELDDAERDGAYDPLLGPPAKGRDNEDSDD